APEGVKRSSGSAVGLPTTVITVSPAIALRTPSLASVRLRSRGSGGGLGPAVLGGGTRGASLLAGLDNPAQNLGPQHRLVEVQLAVQLLDGSGLAVDVQHHVDAFALLVDLKGEPAASPHIDLLDTATVVADDIE